MKKLSFLFAMIFAVTFAMAQNTATTSQTGDDNDVIVNQSGLNNLSTVTQVAAGTQGGVAVFATADIDQQGEGNVSQMEQKAFYGFSNVEVDQIGDFNQARLKTQNGGGDAKVWMKGDNNRLEAYKGAEGTWANQKNYNWFEMSAEGNSNVVGMTQEFGQAKVNILGNLNEVELRQMANSYSHNAEVGVVGTDNDIDVNQANFENKTGGSGNYAQVSLGHDDQVNANPVYLAEYNSVDVTQNGSDNEARFTLKGGDWNDVDILQIGDNNISRISAAIGSDNIINENVDGNTNRTVLKINAAWGASSDNNDVDIDKIGDGNWVSGEIEGDGNEVDILQSGTGNGVGTTYLSLDGINISGDMNTVGISQTGNDNMSLNSITGSGNTISVTQSN